MSAKDLLDNYDISGLHCLNEKPAQPWANALKQGYREDDGMQAMAYTPRMA